MKKIKNSIGDGAGDEGGKAIAIIGIDPGIFGAFAIMGLGDATVIDMPILKIGKKVVLNTQRIRGIFCDQILDHVFIEKAQPMPGNGVVSMFGYGYGAGMIEGILVGLGIKYTLVPPQEWKKKMMVGMGKEKGASIYRVNQLFPNIDIGSRKKDHGKADALLIAEYGYRYKMMCAEVKPT